MERVICVVGPTASGKTALAVDLALRLDGEVVSCRLHAALPGHGHRHRQAHRRRDAAASHIIMLSICPTQRERFSAGRYVEQAAAAVDDILARGKTAILAGGTGLYLDSLISGRRLRPGGRPPRCMPGWRRWTLPPCAPSWKPWTRRAPHACPTPTGGGSSARWRFTAAPARPSRPTTARTRALPPRYAAALGRAGLRQPGAALRPGSTGG